MYLNDDNRAKLRAAVEVMASLPDDSYVSFGFDSLTQSPVAKVQAHSADELRRVRHSFPSIGLWKKVYDVRCSWWEYHAMTDNGVAIHIYACPAPPTCRQVTEEYVAEEDVPTAFEERTETRQVPVAFERRPVTRTRTRTVCGPENGEAMDRMVREAAAQYVA